MMQPWLFYPTATIALCAALGVITAKNPVRAVLFLILACFATAVIWVLLEAEFLAMVLILVYVGAVMVLFLFVVMMLDINLTMQVDRYSNWLFIGISLPVLLAVLLFHSIGPEDFNRAQASFFTVLGADYNNVAVLAKTLFTQYLFHFEIAGIILLVAIVAAIGLVCREPRSRKIQNINRQVQIKKSDRIRLVDL